MLGDQGDEADLERVTRVDERKVLLARLQAELERKGGGMRREERMILTEATYLVLSSEREKWD